VRGTGEDKTDDSQKWQARLFHADKLPMILQAEAAECGLACLAMVAAANGQRHSLSDLRRKFSASLKGTTLKSVMDMADGLGYWAGHCGLRLTSWSVSNRPASSTGAASIMRCYIKCSSGA
jgi:hypothetical protein